MRRRSLKSSKSGRWTSQDERNEIIETLLNSDDKLLDGALNPFSLAFVSAPLEAAFRASYAEEGRIRTRFFSAVSFCAMGVLTIFLVAYDASRARLMYLPVLAAMLMSLSAAFVHFVPFVRNNPVFTLYWLLVLGTPPYTAMHTLSYFVSRSTTYMAVPCMAMIATAVMIRPLWQAGIAASLAMALASFGCEFLWLPLHEAALLTAPYFEVALLNAVLVRGLEVIARRAYYLQAAVREAEEHIAEQFARTDRLARNCLPLQVLRAWRSGKPDWAAGLSRRFESAAVAFVMLEPTGGGEDGVDLARLGSAVARLEALADKSGVEWIKTIGGWSAMCVAGIPEALPAAECAARAVAFACDSVAAARRAGFVVRAGVAVGPLVAGVIGSRLSYDVWGDTANTAHRMAAFTEANTARVTRATRDLVAEDPGFSHFCFPSSGTADVKGKGVMDVFTVERLGPSSAPLPPVAWDPSGLNSAPLSPAGSEPEEEAWLAPAGGDWALGGAVLVPPSPSLAGRALWAVLGPLVGSRLRGGPSPLSLRFGDRAVEDAFWRRRRAASLGALRHALGLSLLHALAWPALEYAARYPPHLLYPRLALRYALSGAPTAAAILVTLLRPRLAARRARPLVLLPALATAAYLALELAWLTRDPSGPPDPGQAASLAVADLQFFVYFSHLLPGPVVSFRDRVPFDAALLAVYVGGQWPRIASSLEGAYELLIHLLILLVITLVGWLNEYVARREFDLDREAAGRAAALAAESRSTRRLLELSLPSAVIRHMLDKEGALDDSRLLRFDSVVVLCADIVNFTPLSSLLDAADLVRILDDFVTRVDAEAEAHRAVRLKLVGDAYYAVLGLEAAAGPPEAARLVDLGERLIGALEAAEATARARRPGIELPPLRARVGVALGPAAGGLVGARKWCFELFGPAIERATALEHDGVPSRVHVCPAVRDAIAAGYATEPWGGCASALDGPSPVEPLAQAPPPSSFLVARGGARGPTSTPRAEASVVRRRPGHSPRDAAPEPLP